MRWAWGERSEPGVEGPVPMSPRRGMLPPMSTAARRGWGDVALAIVVVAVVAMMLVPLPRAAIDVLLAVSLTSAVVILLSAVYAQSPARLTTLPTLVLL